VLGAPSAPEIFDTAHTFSENKGTWPNSYMRANRVWEVSIDGTKLMGRILKIGAHILLFLLALVMFYIGLFLGLQVNPNYGNLMWIGAAAIAGLNILWIVRSQRR
jgi:hypothetical protein